MSIIRPFRLSRRAMLKGMGAAIALPALECMLNGNGDALADGTALPRRFGVFFFGNGVRLSRFVPDQTGTSWQLSEELAPLANVKDYVNVVSGHNVFLDNVRGHHSGEASVLSAVPLIELPHAEGSFSSKFGGPSIDQMAAASIGTTTRFPSLELGISKRVVTGEGPTLQFISHKGPDQPLPTEVSPAALFARLFDAAPPDVEDPILAVRASVLDAVRADIDRLKPRLGTADRSRLDAHLTSISELRQIILASPPVFTETCAMPASVPYTNEDVDGVEPLNETMRAMADLLALAFACDLTRVSSIMYTGSVAQTIFTDVGATSEQHGLTHDEAQQELVHQTVVYSVAHFAYLLEKLKATPEGAGNLLDQTCFFMTSDCAEGLSHSNDDYPMVIAGRAGGALKYPGTHYRPPFLPKNTSNVLLAMMQAIGTGMTSIGSGLGHSSNPTSEILA